MNASFLTCCAAVCPLLPTIAAVLLILDGAAAASGQAPRFFY